MREPRITPEIEAQMARDLGADSLRYLPLESVSRAVAKPAKALCQACLNGEYPTPAGEKLYQISLAQTANDLTGAPSRIVELSEPVLSTRL
jgi:amidophosphoribosyltransferase